MADKSINQLPVSAGLTDDGLLVVYQNSETKSIRGNLIKQFAQQGIEAAMAEAKASGEFDGKDGENGEDAVSPTIAVSDITGGHRLTVTDKNGTNTVDVLDGTDGYTPVKGKDYFDGEDGEDGYTPQKNVDYFDGKDGKDGVSPTITVAAITGGHSITITDATGTKTVDVMDGKDGADGMGSGDMLAADYDPQKKKQDIFAYVDNAIPTVPTNVSAFTNDAGYITGYTETDPTVPSWAKSASKPTYTASEVGAAASSHNQGASTITAGTFAGQVVANSGGETYSTYLLRNTRLASSDTTPSNNGEICWTYE